MLNYACFQFKVLFFICLLFASTAYSATINFSGELAVVLEDSGGAIYSGTSTGTVFSGSIDDITAVGQISNGSILTSFSCCDAAGGLSLSNNLQLSTEDAQLLNTIAQSNLFMPGDIVDGVNIEGDSGTASGGRIEVGLSYILQPDAFDNEDLSGYPFDNNDVLLSLFFILEEDSTGDNDIYDSLGRITSPTITSVIEDMAIVGELYDYQVTATDPTSGDVLAFSLDAAPAGMSIELASGQIQWTPALDQAGTVDVAVRVTDSSGGFATQSFAIQVVSGNVGPSIISTPVTVAVVGENYRYEVSAVSPDQSDSLTYSLDNAPSGMTVDEVSGVLLWSPVASQIGENDVRVRVTGSNGLTDTQGFGITVSAQNTAPVADAGVDQSVTVGFMVVLDGSGSSDADDDELSYEWMLSVPAGSASKLSDKTSVTPAFAPDVDGDYTARLVVNDGLLSSEPDETLVTVITDGTGIPSCEGMSATIFVNEEQIIVGGPGNGRSYRGVLKGTAAADVIVGTGGNDIIRGFRGDDVICALAGVDWVRGGKGADVLSGGPDRDFIRGGRGADTLIGGGGNDKLFGGRGDDWLDGGTGFDALNGGRNTDTCLNGEFRIRRCETVE